MKIAGLALATSISGIITFIVLFAALRRKLGDFRIKEIILSFLRILAASICMGIVCLLVSSRNITVWHNHFDKILNLTLALAAGLFSYIVFSFLFGVSEMRELRQWFINRKQP
jgi:putative peptidoglycan lipid II flippase